MKKYKSPLLIPGILLAITAIVSGILLPKYLLSRKANSQISIVNTAPEDYYLASGTAMAQNASRQLSSLDRIKLISGKWESISEQCSTKEGFLTESEAVALAKKQLEYYYETSAYPYSLTSAYDNWYSWTTELYKYTDTAFNTYTAYLWVIKFTKFDNSVTHTILMTESGTIINAETNDNTIKHSQISKAYLKNAIGNIFCDSDLTALNISENNKTDIHIPYPYIDLTDTDIEYLTNVSISLNSNESENYIIYQYKTDTSYGVGIIPE